MFKTTYSKQQRDVLRQLAFQDEIGSAYMCIPRVRDERRMNAILRAAHLCIVRTCETCYAMPTTVGRCPVCVAPTAGDAKAMGAFVDAIFDTLHGARKVYSGATQNVAKRLLDHQSDLLPDEEWSACHVLLCTPDIEVARRLETVQNHIVHNMTERSEGRLVTPNSGRSLISRGLRRAAENGPPMLYALYLLIRRW